VTFGGFVGFCSILPLFFHEQYHVDGITAGSIAALCGLVGSFIRPLGGYAADRIGGLRTLMLALPLIAGIVAALGVCCGYGHCLGVGAAVRTPSTPTNQSRGSTEPVFSLTVGAKKQC
jgi:nitrate/nitrite transporter NarK